ncbi:SCO family protein [Aureimonas fodinaquatilis]|uniref:SCO family protein n=2 Tax=Aureimonas fodinaquatilis TaxID=2565783 RepID=A0A5B0E4T7_9HYPH|nr:SCO family protein [Aureimonas fodinaquatilis]
MVVVVAVALAIVWALGARQVTTVGQALEPYGTPFQLTDQNGETISETDLRGGAAAVFFGFTHCPEVCPTTLYELAGHQQALAADGQELKVFFVTVDPERDTPEVMKSYISGLDANITAISGDPEAVRAMLKGWGVHYTRVETDGDYTMDHTASVFLLGREGQFVGTLAYGENTDTAREKLKRLTTL